MLVPDEHASLAIFTIASRQVILYVYIHCYCRFRCGRDEASVSNTESPVDNVTIIRQPSPMVEG